jgi:hypothetical protein
MTTRYGADGTYRRTRTQYSVFHLTKAEIKAAKKKSHEKGYYLRQRKIMQRYREREQQSFIDAASSRLPLITD